MAVYFIQAGDVGPVKIGSSRAPWSRLATFQIANAAELKMLGVMAALREDEKHILLRFARHWIRGEWFAPHPELLAFAAQHYMAPPPSHIAPHRRGIHQITRQLVAARAA